MPPSPPRILAISDRRVLGGATRLLDWASSLAALGVPALLLREKDLDDHASFEAARALRARLPTAQLLVSARFDVALAAGADGVHLPASGLPVAAVRAAVGPAFLIGRSTHSWTEVAAAQADGADYVTFGPVWETPSKAAFGPPQGIPQLARTTQIGLPVLALGGVTLGCLATVARAGAWGAAAIRPFADAPTAAAFLAEAREAWACDLDAERNPR
jgi:thiamine-phosphate pyrophosphorylase